MDKKEAYRAVFYFYEQLAYEDRDSLISVIHGSMQLLQNGSPADGSVEGDWEKALAMSQSENSESIDTEVAYTIARNLIGVFYESNSEKPRELKELVDRMNQHETKIEEYWEKALVKAKDDKEGVMLRFG